jgi:hypothetical protein
MSDDRGSSWVGPFLLGFLLGVLVCIGAGGTVLMNWRRAEAMREREARERAFEAIREAEAERARMDAVMARDLETATRLLQETAEKKAEEREK